MKQRPIYLKFLSNEYAVLSTVNISPKLKKIKRVPFSVATGQYLFYVPFEFMEVKGYKIHKNT